MDKIVYKFLNYIIPLILALSIFVNAGALEKTNFCVTYWDKNYGVDETDCIPVLTKNTLKSAIVDLNNSFSRVKAIIDILNLIPNVDIPVKLPTPQNVDNALTSLCGVGYPFGNFNNFNQIMFGVDYRWNRLVFVDFFELKWDNISIPYVYDSEYWPLPTIKTYGTYGSGDGQFSMPMGVSSNEERIIVADVNNNRIVKLGYSTTSEDFFWRGSVSGFSRPNDVCFLKTFANSNNSKLDVVADTYNNRLVILSRFLGMSGNITLTDVDDGVDQEGYSNVVYINLAEHGGLKAPMGVASHYYDFYKNIIYVADTQNDRIVRLFIDYETKPFDENSIIYLNSVQLRKEAEIVKVAIDRNGHVWAIDKGQNQVHKFSKTLEYLNSWGGNGDNIQFNKPIYAKFRSPYDDILHLVEEWSDNSGVQNFDVSGMSVIYTDVLVKPWDFPSNMYGITYLAIKTDNDFDLEYSWEDQDRTYTKTNLSAGSHSIYLQYLHQGGVYTLNLKIKSGRYRNNIELRTIEVTVPSPIVPKNPKIGLGPLMFLTTGQMVLHGKVISDNNLKNQSGYMSFNNKMECLNNGDLNIIGLEYNQDTFLDNITNLSNGLTIKRPDGKPVFFISNEGKGYLRKSVFPNVYLD